MCRNHPIQRLIIIERNNSAERSNRRDTCMLDEPNITLTPRQQRALRHLARRHMHHPRVTRRRMFADYTSPPVGDLPPGQVILPGEQVSQSSAPGREEGQPTQPIAPNREKGQAAPDEQTQPDVLNQIMASDEEEGQAAEVLIPAGISSPSRGDNQDKEEGQAAEVLLKDASMIERRLRLPRLPRAPQASLRRWAR
jgi:hypothetical protein